MQVCLSCDGYCFRKPKINEWELLHNDNGDDSGEEERIDLLQLKKEKSVYRIVVSEIMTKKHHCKKV